MFTGIVTDMGKVLQLKKKGDSIKFFIKPIQKNYLERITDGSSIAINGACMTIEKNETGSFTFTTIKESLSKTNLGKLKIGSFVNLEKPMKINATLDGHIVQGHVDSVGIISRINKLKDSREYFIEFNPKFRDNIIYVGSIAVNGISLTIAEIVKDTPKKLEIKVAIIPHTYKVTNFKFFRVGDIVNLEFDMLGKYVKRVMGKNK
jgi:riboflavin synthase